MTTVTFDIDVDTAAGLVAADGSIHFTPWPGARVEASKLVMPAGFSLKIPTAATFNVDLPPTTEAWAWRVRIQTRRGGGTDLETFYVQVPSSGTHAFTSLTQVDPKSLEPGAEPGAAWDLALTALTERVDEFEGANPGVIAQAVDDYLDANPASGLPSGGTTGQVAAKASSADGDVTWIDPATGDFEQLDNVPSTFPPSAHDHSISDVTGLEAALEGASAPTYANIPAGSTIRVFYTTSWPARPTTRTDISVEWIDLTGDASPSVMPTEYVAGVDTFYQTATV